jgi:hypothetical protein
MNPHCGSSECTLHIQSFLYAISIDTLQLLLSSGNIYDCLGNNAASIVIRNELGMGQTVLSNGYRIAVPHMNFFELGTNLVMDQNSLNNETIRGFFQQSSRKGDIWYEEQLRKTTETLNSNYLQRFVGQETGNFLEAIRNQKFGKTVTKIATAWRRHYT